MEDVKTKQEVERAVAKVRRTLQVNIKLSEAELEVIRANMKRLGWDNLSEFLRDAAMTAKKQK